MQRPQWLKIRATSNDSMQFVKEILLQEKLNTVCENASCPNIFECYSKKTATFLIMGNICTRNCRFCDIQKGSPEAIDYEEPYRIARAVKKLDLDYVVITSVTRDDLSDKGINQFTRCVIEIRKISRHVLIELLVPDFKGLDYMGLNDLLITKPDVINHNIETIERLYPVVRPNADYNYSLNLLKKIKEDSSNIITKSGMILGLGEGVSEVVETMKDLRKVGCDIITLGQYLSPSTKHLKVSRYLTPQEFNMLKDYGKELGFLSVASGPLVRSSYQAKELFKRI